MSWRQPRASSAIAAMPCGSVMERPLAQGMNEHGPRVNRPGHCQAGRVDRPGHCQAGEGATDWRDRADEIRWRPERREGSMFHAEAAKVWKTLEAHKEALGSTTMREIFAGGRRTASRSSRSSSTTCSSISPATASRARRAISFSPWRRCATSMSAATRCCAATRSTRPKAAPCCTPRCARRAAPASSSTAATSPRTCMTSSPAASPSPPMCARGRRAARRGTASPTSSTSASAAPISARRWRPARSPPIADGPRTAFRLERRRRRHLRTRSPASTPSARSSSSPRRPSPRSRR